MADGKDVLISATLGLVIGLICGGLLVWAFWPKPSLVPSQPDKALRFYVSYLQSINVTVTEKELSVNDYEKASFQEFLWILKEANVTECYVDYGSHDLFLVGERSPKLWLQFDGTYWEVRP